MLMRICLSGVLFASISGCTTKNEDRAYRGVAVVSRATMSGEPGTSIVFLNEVNAPRVQEIVSGQRPKFQWIAIDLGADKEQALYSEGGVSLDLKQPDPHTTFSQSYAATCNPALDNHNSCWLYESYTAGDTGLDGLIELRLSEERVFGSLQVSWSGITDRFGEPLQPLTHNTNAPIAAPIMTSGDIQ